MPDVYPVYPTIDYDVATVTQPIPDFGDEQPPLGSQVLRGRCIARRKAYTALALLDWDPHQKDSLRARAHAESAIREAIARNVVRDHGR